MRELFDFANYTLPFTTAQIDVIRQSKRDAMIGLQVDTVAARFKYQLQGVCRRSYYTDRPGRNLTVPEPRALCAADVEKDCIETRADLDQCLAEIVAAGLRPAIYTNAEGWRPIGSTAYSHLPLLYADYGPPSNPYSPTNLPTLAKFQPFGGWRRPWGWQYANHGMADINADLSIVFPEAPMIRLNATSAWYEDPAHQDIPMGETRGVNAVTDFGVPPDAPAVEAEVFLQRDSAILEVWDGDEAAPGGRAFTVVDSGFAGRVNLSPDGWFHLKAAGAVDAHIAHVNIVGYYED